MRNCRRQLGSAAAKSMRRDEIMETITELIRTFSKDHKPCYEAEDGETLCCRTIE